MTPMDTGDAVLEVVRLLSVGVVSACATTWLSARFGFQKFRKEEMWKQKRDAYHSAISEIGRIRSDAANLMDHDSTNGLVPRRVIGRDNLPFSLRELAAAGDHLLSAQSMAAIKSVVEAQDDIGFNTAFEHADSLYGVAERALIVLRKEFDTFINE